VISPEQADGLVQEIEATTEASVDREDACRAAMRLIARHLPQYHWVGVYVLQGGMLILGPHVGAATEHTIIPVGRGVCGTAVTHEKNQIVADVTTVENYLACSADARSEIVVLIRDPESGEILGQIDADSHDLGAFDQTDEAFLERIAARLATRWTPAE
jgi:L-methionine (R)-S-oxide reductase